MGIFAVKVKQVLSEVVVVNDENITTQEEACALVQKFDQEVGVDPQEIEDVVFEKAEIPDDPYVLTIGKDDVENNEEE